MSFFCGRNVVLKCVFASQHRESPTIKFIVEWYITLGLGIFSNVLKHHVSGEFVPYHVVYVLTGHVAINSHIASFWKEAG
jgi:hypothetical protein